MARVKVKSHPLQAAAVYEVASPRVEQDVIQLDEGLVQATAPGFYSGIEQYIGPIPDRDTRLAGWCGG